MENYKLYHATNIKSANNIINTNKFDVPKDIENRELLGEGAYYYQDRQDAIEWNSRTINKKSGKLFPSYKELKDMYAIIESEVEVENNDILDLDIRENVIKYKIAVETVKDSLKDIHNYNDRNELGTIINFLYLKNRMKKKMIVKTILYKIPSSYGIKILKRVYCIKDTKILVNYKLSTPINWNEYNIMKQLYS